MPQHSAANALLDVDIREYWGSGLVVDASFEAASPLDGWRLAFRYGGEITHLWNARIVDRDGDLYVIENESYNGTIPAGGSAAFGFVGAGSADTVQPVSLNGEAFDGAAPVDTGGGTETDGDGDGGTGMDHDGHQHGSGAFTDITEFGVFHGTSSHTMHDDLNGGRTAITTEALEAYNDIRAFLGLEPEALETIGQWAFDNDMTNNDQAWGGDLQGVGLYYAMQGAKVGWIADDAFDPQILADIQREARLGDPDAVLAMVKDHGHPGLADYLVANDLFDTFLNTLKMEPHYGGWMHGRVHGDLIFPDGDGARSHDVNHLTVLSHDQMQPFMNDTFDWPQWPALDVPHDDVIDYFQSMLVLGDPLGDELPAGTVGGPGDPSGPLEPEPEPEPPAAGDGSDILDANLVVKNDWGSGAVVRLDITNTSDEAYNGGWDLTFAFDADGVVSASHADWSAVTDGIAVSDVGWNGRLKAGQTKSAWFKLDDGNLDEAQLNADAEFSFL